MNLRGGGNMMVCIGNIFTGLYTKMNDERLIQVEKL